MKIALSRYSAVELLRLHASIIDELKAIKVVRTINNPVGDYTEWLVAKALKLDLSNNSVSGYDGTDKKGIKYQIKGRRITPDTKSTQLSAIRKLDNNEFDFLIAVIFDRDYNVKHAVKIPHKVVRKYASYRKSVNAHILHIKGSILNEIEDISSKLAHYHP